MNVPRQTPTVGVGADILDKPRILHLRYARSEAWRPYLLSLPSLIVTIGVLIPFALAVAYSMQKYNLSFPAGRRFVWFGNYLDMARDARFWHTLTVTLLYTGWAVVSELVLGMIIALLLSRPGTMSRILTPLLVLPLMVAPAVGSLMWKLMTNPVFGLANYFLSFVGHRNFPWASSPTTALLTVVMVDVWIFTPFMALLLLAGLRSLPQQPFEAARLDGAPWPFIFRHLTLPLLAPYIITAALFRVLDSLQQFDIIYAMTQGGPGDALLNFQVRSYLEAFSFLNIGTASAYLMVLWGISYAISQAMVVYWSRTRARLRGFA